MATDVYSFTPTVSGADNTALRFSVTGLPAWASFNTQTGAITGTPEVDDVGQYSNITIAASDGNNHVQLPPFSITVTNIVYGSITLSWRAPTQYTDGSPLTDLDGFRLYWGRTAGVYPNNVTIENESVSTYVLENIPIGEYAFAATAFNADGVESRYSAPMRALVR